MKKIKLILIFCGLSQFILAQTDCKHSVTTDYRAPYNNSLPINSPSYGERFLNSFNWNALTVNLTLANYNLKYMQYNQNMQNVMSSQASDYLHISEGEKMVPEHGWELMLLNIGTYPNGEDFPDAEGYQDIPYIVFYNRYSGILRVFANYGNGFLPTGVAFDAVQIDLTYSTTSILNNKINGVLRLNQGIDQALDQPAAVTKVVALAKHPNSPQKWFSADFQLTYDPCVCFHPSKMQLNFKFTTSQNLTLVGRSVSIEQDLINGTILNNNKDFLTSFDNSQIGNLDHGTLVMYKAMSSLVDDYISKIDHYSYELQRVNQHNASVARNKAVMEMFRSIVLQGSSAAVDEVKKWPLWDTIVNYANDLVGVDSLVRKKDIFKEAKKVLASSINTFYANNFKFESLPTEPSMPRATFSEMVIKGTLSDTIPVAGPIFFTPGTYESIGTPSVNIDSYFQYPLYNNAVGNFALLKSPKLLISKTIQDSRIIHRDGLDYLPYFKFFTKNFQFQLNEDLLYAFNDVLDIDEYDINASFVFHLRTKRIENEFFPNGHVDPLYTTNLISDSINIDSFSPINTNLSTSNHPRDDQFNMVNGSHDLIYIGESSTRTNAGKFTLRTPVLPIEAFKQNVSSFGIMNTFQSNDFAQVNAPDLSFLEKGVDLVIDRVELKLLINTKFKKIRLNGTQNESTQILTYYLNPNDFDTINQELVTNLENSNQNYLQYPENLSLSNITFSGQQVKGCHLVSGTYSCRSWNDINLEGLIKADNGIIVNFIAGHEIYESNETSIEGEVIRSINPILDYSNPMPKAQLNQVTAFCTGTNKLYNADKPKNLIIPSNTASPVDGHENRIAPIDFNLSPNPTRESVKISLNQQAHLVQIQVMDIMGKMQELSPQRINETDYLLNTQKMASGLYLVKITADGEIRTKQLIVK